MDDFLKIITSKLEQKIAFQNQRTLYSNPSNLSGHVIQNFLIGYHHFHRPSKSTAKCVATGISNNFRHIYNKCD